MKERERMDAWKEIEGNLLSEELVPIIPAQEWKGLTLLVDNLVSSNVCSTEEKGRIVAELDSDVEVVLLFEKMLRRRIDFLSHRRARSHSRPEKRSVSGSSVGIDRGAR